MAAINSGGKGIGQSQNSRFLAIAAKNEATLLDKGMAEQLYSTVDLSRLLGVAEHRIVYAHRTGKLADASFLIAGKRVYSQDDLRRVAAYFGIALDYIGNGRNVDGRG